MLRDSGKRRAWVTDSGHPSALRFNFCVAGTGGREIGVWSWGMVPWQLSQSNRRYSSSRAHGARVCPAPTSFSSVGLRTRDDPLCGVLRVQHAPIVRVDLPGDTQTGPKAISILVGHVQAAVSAVLVGLGLVLEIDTGMIWGLLGARRAGCSRNGFAVRFCLGKHLNIGMRNRVTGARLFGALAVAGTARDESDHAFSDKGASNLLWDPSSSGFVSHGFGGEGKKGTSGD